VPDRSRALIAAVSYVDWWPVLADLTGFSMPSPNARLTGCILLRSAIAHYVSNNAGSKASGRMSGLVLHEPVSLLARFASTTPTLTWWGTLATWRLQLGPVPHATSASEELLEVVDELNGR